MLEYATKAELKKWGSEQPLSETATLKKSASSAALSNATFLSHSSKDQELVAGAARILSNHGTFVYIDEIDPTMPPYTSEETARILKRRIRETSRFVLLASDNSKDSKWVPWELGIADGFKNTSEIALFPASETANNKSWASWEYLGLYSKIVWGDMEGYNKPLWMVLDENTNRGTPLTKWLSSKTAGSERSG